MKSKYITPVIEIYQYYPESGYSSTVALHKDHVLVEGNDNSTTRSSEEITDVTDYNGEYMSAEWIMN